MLVSELKKTCSLAERQAVSGPRPIQSSRDTRSGNTRCNVREAATEACTPPRVEAMERSLQSRPFGVETKTHSDRSIAAGSMRAARITAGSAANTVAANTVSHGTANAGASDAFTP